jgi:hypothetical protein
MSKTKILKCSCKNSYQNGRYGRGKRVHNETMKPKGQTPKEYRCTVCGAERFAGVTDETQIAT